MSAERGAPTGSTGPSSSPASDLRADEPPASLPGGEAPETAARDRRTRLLRIIGGIASAALFLFSLVVLFALARELEAAEVSAAFRRAGAEQIGLALFFTALSYLMLTGYDWVALKEVTTRVVSYRLAALASFTSYAVSFTLGFPLLTAATVRYWVYSSVGLTASAIASLTLIAGITFWLGMGVVLGSVMIAAPHSTAIFTRLPLALNIALGAAIFAAILAYCITAARGAGGRRFVVRGWQLKLPSVNVTLKQMALGAADVSAGAAVLYVLLPPEAQVPFPAMLAAYVFACLLGIASHAPGGIGVFEATMLLALPGVPREALLGALLIYRLCYYLLPFVLALVLLGSRELLLRAGMLQRQIAAQPRGDADG